MSEPQFVERAMALLCATLVDDDAAVQRAAVSLARELLTPVQVIALRALAWEGPLDEAVMKVSQYEDALPRLVQLRLVSHIQARDGTCIWGATRLGASIDKFFTA